MNLFFLFTLPALLWHFAVAQSLSNDICAGVPNLFGCKGTHKVPTSVAVTKGFNYWRYKTVNTCSAVRKVLGPKTTFINKSPAICTCFPAILKADAAFKSASTGVGMTANIQSSLNSALAAQTVRAIRVSGHVTVLTCSSVWRANSLRR